MIVFELKISSKTHDSKVKLIVQTVFDRTHKFDSTIANCPFGLHDGLGKTVDPSNRYATSISIEPLQLFMTQIVDIGFRSKTGPNILEAKLNLIYLQLLVLIRIKESTGLQIGSGLQFKFGLQSGLQSGLYIGSGFGLVQIARGRTL